MSLSSKVKQYRGITVINAIAPSMAKKTRRLLQWVPARPIPIEEVERMNAVVVRNTL